MDRSRIVSTSRSIKAPAATVFELIADPARQPEWDGNGNLHSAAPGQRVRSAGDVFVMTLTHDHAVRENHVVEFEEGRLMAWRPSEVGGPQPGHLWRWEVEPQSDGCLVTHTYDWSELTDESRFKRAESTSVAALAASLDRLAARAEATVRH